jgi:hypothetical protein
VSASALVNNRFLARAQPEGAFGPFPGFGPAPPPVALVGSAGVAATASRSDHTHQDGPIQTAYDVSPLGPPLVVLSPTVGPFAIRDAAAPIGTLFRVANNAGTSQYVEVSPTLQVELGEDLSTSTGPGEAMLRIQGSGDLMRFWPSDRTWTANQGSLMRLIGTYVANYATVTFGALNLQATFRHQQAGGLFNHFLVFNNGMVFENVSGVAVNFGPGQTFISQPTIRADAAAITMSQNRDLLIQPVFATAGGGTLAVTTWSKIQLFGSVGAGVTVTTLRGVHVGALTSAAGVITTHIGVEIDDLVGGTTINGIRSAMTGAAKRFINHTGTSPSDFAGNINLIGAATRFNFSASAALGGGAAATLGTIGGAGPTVAAQNSWLPILVAGAVRFIPIWA